MKLLRSNSPPVCMVPKLPVAGLSSTPASIPPAATSSAVKKASPSSWEHNKEWWLPSRFTRGITLYLQQLVLLEGLCWPYCFAVPEALSAEVGVHLDKKTVPCTRMEGGTIHFLQETDQPYCVFDFGTDPPDAETCESMSANLFLDSAA